MRICKESLCKRFVSVLNVIAKRGTRLQQFMMAFIINRIKQPLPSHPYEREELLTSLGLIEGTAEVAGGGDAALLLHASHLHAHVLSLYYNHHALRVQCLVDGFAYLLGKALLKLKTVTEHIYHTGNLA